MNKSEKPIYWVNNLPSILYFGSVGIVFYDVYCNAVTDTEFLNDWLQSIAYVFFFYKTYFAGKNSKKKQISASKNNHKIIL